MSRPNFAEINNDYHLLNERQKHRRSNICVSARIEGGNPSDFVISKIIDDMLGKIENPENVVDEIVEYHNTK